MKLDDLIDTLLVAVIVGCSLGLLAIIVIVCVVAFGAIQ